MTSKVCHKESQDFCQVGIAGSWKLVSAGELWGSDCASQQRAVCCGTDSAAASHCPQLSGVKIDGETER